jgi:oligopeptide/dipeptide ABC transporter ATP-binding protein
MALLEVRNLRTRFTVDERELYAVDGVSFEIDAGRTLGIVGESGSGKSVTALSLLGLLREPGKVADGKVLFEGRDLLELPERELERVRGDRIAMIFQEPMTSLNPVMTCGDQVAEPLVIHRGASWREARAEAAALFRKVGIADPERRVREYPHQMSGGMRQRVMIAMALACRPQLLIADEPTTALDVTIQAQILELLAVLRKELKMAMLLITHDLGVVAERCDEVLVMYAGQVVERAPARELFTSPRHPYTAGLLGAIPALQPVKRGADRKLREIKGMVPPLHALPAGCRFQDRCEHVEQRCRDEKPPLDRVSPERLVRCIKPLGRAQGAHP